MHKSTFLTGCFSASAIALSNKAKPPTSCLASVASVTISSCQLKTKKRKSSIHAIRIRLSCVFVRLGGLKSCLKRYFEIRRLSQFAFLAPLPLTKPFSSFIKCNHSFRFAAVGMQVSSWRYRTMVTPGLSGFAQVTGGYDLLPKEKILLDLWESSSRVTAGDMALLAPVGWRFR